MRRLSATLGRVARAVEVVAALCLAAVTVLVFASAIGRYLFAAPIPEAFDVSRFLLGASIMWGFAVLGFRGGHIAVDLVAEASPPRLRRAMDVLAQSVLLGFTILLAWKLQARVGSALASDEATFDLRLPVWPMLGLIWLGVAAAVVTSAARLLALVTGAQVDGEDQGVRYDE